MGVIGFCSPPDNHTWLYFKGALFDTRDHPKHISVGGGSYLTERKALCTLAQACLFCEGMHRNVILAPFTGRYSDLLSIYGRIPPPFLFVLFNKNKK